MTSLTSLIPEVNGAERHERARRLAGDDLGDRGLSRSGRSPEDAGRHAIFGDRAPQESTRRRQRRLPDDVVERSWSHAVGQWACDFASRMPGCREDRKGCVSRPDSIVDSEMTAGADRATQEREGFGRDRHESRLGHRIFPPFENLASVRSPFG